jgi:hypothetical protein
MSERVDKRGNSLAELRERTEVMELKARLIEAKLRIVAAEIEFSILAEDQPPAKPRATGTDGDDVKRLRSELVRLTRGSRWGT